MNTSTPTQPPKRQDRLLREQVHDTYRPRGQLGEPTRCPDCGAVYRRGRWSWAPVAAAGVGETRCSACRRIADGYPAGELSLDGGFLRLHKKEILNLVRNTENAESRDHPMNRIMAIFDDGRQVRITTTDTHLPRRIGKALKDAWEGDLDIHFDAGGCFTRVTWRRDA